MSDKIKQEPLRVNKQFEEEKLLRDSIKNEIKKDVLQATKDLLDLAQSHEDRVEILLMEILRASKLE